MADSAYKKQLGLFGKILSGIKVIKIYTVGGSIDFIINKWNPLSYIFLLVIIIYLISVGGFPAVLSVYKYNKFGLIIPKQMRNKKIEYLK